MTTKPSFPSSAALLSALAAAASMLAGCAQIPADAGRNPADPYERFNRHVWAFNDAVDRAVAKPVAEAYVEWTPEFVRRRVSSAVDNLYEPNNALNNILQGKIDDGVSSIFRFLVNSTFGIAGMFDVASVIGMEPKPEDFGQTLGVWGVSSGSYLVLPFLGPSSTRDLARYPVQFAASPLTYALWDEDWWISAGITTVVFIDGRARLLKFEDLRKNVFDDYVAVREVYLASRENAVRDGVAPEGEEALGGLAPLDFDGDE